ncbi:MAG: sigma-70 family RNA polymerase sigma factor [Sedimentisphaerales bacterium]|nr:sigma-70 family RNA polymerase sigma factor [Sedimentisphaerales bacterium]
MLDSDKSLIDAHIGGDRTAFGELVRRHGDSVLGYLVRMTGNREQAEDFFQETFERVHEKGHTFRGERFKSWLFTIATRVAIDGLRKRKRQPVLSLNQSVGCDTGNCDELGAFTAADCCDPAQEVEIAEQKEQVRRAVDELPAKQRATLVLAYYQQLSYPEVAEVLGCSTGTVKVQMSRALRTLANRLPDVSGVAK